MKVKIYYNVEVEAEIDDKWMEIMNFNEEGRTFGYAQLRKELGEKKYDELMKKNFECLKKYSANPDFTNILSVEACTIETIDGKLVAED